MSHPSIDKIVPKTSLSDAPTEALAPDASARSRLFALAFTVSLLVATVAVGFAGGYAAKLLQIPLPYMTGALLVRIVIVLLGAAGACRLFERFVAGRA